MRPSIFRITQLALISAFAVLSISVASSQFQATLQHKVAFGVYDPKILAKGMLLVNINLLLGYATEFVAALKKARQLVGSPWLQNHGRGNGMEWVRHYFKI